MARKIKAFVSYRRDDHYPSEFLVKLQQSLHAAGVSEVFLDTRTLQPGDAFEQRIHRTIAECDLFVPLIGQKWMEILKLREASGDTDVLLQEVASALQLDKEIVPLLVDGAPMPKLEDLPPPMVDLPASNGKAVSSSISVAELASVFQDPVKDAHGVRRLGDGWSIGYYTVALLAWFVIGIVPNAIGIWEFGDDVWFTMAAGWSGLFIYPVFFLPFIFVALHQPYQILFEAALNARTTRDAVKFLSPLPIGMAIAAVVTFIEIAPPQTPWTIHPKLHEACESAPPDPGPGPRAGEARTTYLKDRTTLYTYGQTDLVRERYSSQFWMRDKCWPHVFYYLTVPLIENRTDQAYLAERATVVAAMNRYLAIDSKNERKGTAAPYSSVFWAYALSFYVISSFMISCIAIALIFLVVSIRRTRDDKVLHVPTEDAYLCLNFAFVTVMIWVPFRMATNSLKLLYTCSIEPGTCDPRWDIFVKDGAFALGFLIFFCCLVVGMLRRQKRVLLALLGTVFVSTFAAIAYLVARYSSVLAPVTGYWVFWTALSVLISLLLIALWYLYDPAIVRLRDVIAMTRRRRKQKRGVPA
jgi:hypothetical protein